MNKLRIGVVGLGGIAQKAWLPVLGASADWTLKGAFSPSREKAQRICDTGGYLTLIHWLIWRKPAMRFSSIPVPQRTMRWSANC